jgi:hypothetical protein
VYTKTRVHANYLADLYNVYSAVYGFAAVTALRARVMVVVLPMG